MSIEHYDAGTVIGYQPDLEYKKESTSSAEVSAGDTLINSNSTEYSKTISSINNNTPSTVLTNIDYAVESIKKLIDNLSQSFHDNNWNEYNNIGTLLSAINNNDNNYIEAFINSHKNDISKDIVPELIGYLYDEQKRLEVLYNIIQELYYGPNCSNPSEIDKAYIDKLKSYENSGTTEKINYLALSSDATLNRGVYIHALNTIKKATILTTVVKKTDSAATNREHASLIQKMFDEVNDEIKYRDESYNHKQTLEIMEKTLYNYYYRRKELLDLYNIFETSSDSIFIGRKIEKYSNNLQESIKNVLRSLKSSELHLEEINTLEQEKYFLKNIYSNIDYNS